MASDYSNVTFECNGSKYVLTTIVLNECLQLHVVSYENMHGDDDIMDMLDKFN